ncbi:bifunctional tetrahydrofolate synthase/dihydrofolate synthase [Catenovulum sp. 2E275]|uniref:bifunctional tetrahydrofolate synthase/dihydrofolate synthase n=1 Tax=Catenovulum sp. 2E275 TaxID=2980497 RepID=UPI0021D342C6|nr:bifunctional tetrahydrofolate synthase/dihydrofolate synthase [Catenovulum sp. 2E275]MCU4675680.1 bifunctional tetrahydrofolate synthase/dihydrofolate synthase [Catenovulum sp. 2E275]
MVTTPATADFDNLPAWLSHLESLHPKDIELGLERVQSVYNQLALNFSSSKVILIAGTNGKGTSCHLMQQILTAHGYSVGCYNSPHISDYRERVTLNTDWFSEQQHCQAFAAIEQARGETPLTYFEFGTLAAIYLLAQAKPDFILLEVGLGGRLDATNIVEPDLSVITTIDLDHQDWLGTNREVIGFEKAGIFRTKGLAVCGDLNPPDTVKQQALEKQLNIVWQQQDFHYQVEADTWSWQGQKSEFNHCIKPNMPLQNASTVLACFEQLNIRLNTDTVNQCFKSFQLAGRWQQIAHSPNVIIDVAHNPESIRFMREKLNQTQCSGKKIAVFGMLKDKDIKTVVESIKDSFELWLLADINQPRGAKATDLAEYLPKNAQVECFGSIEQAYQAAQQQASADDLIVVFGSFWVITDILTD